MLGSQPAGSSHTPTGAPTPVPTPAPATTAAGSALSHAPVVGTGTGRTRARRTPAAARVLRHAPWLVAVLLAALYATYSLSRYAQFASGAYDLGIFDQAVRAYSHLRAPIVPIKGDGFNILGDHFHPILVLLAPLYWLWDDPRTLLLAQAVLVAASALVVRRFAARHVGERAALVVMVGYGLAWPVQGLISFDVHEVAFAVPLLAWALDALDRRRDVELAVACALLLGTREDLGLVVAVLGLLRCARRPRWVGAALAGGGVVAFGVVMGVVVPAFSTRGGYTHWNVHRLGPDAGSAARSVVTDPLHFLNVLVTPDTKVWTLVALLAPLLLLPLLSPYSLAAVPLLVVRFVDDRPGPWGVHFHYNAPVWVVLVLGAVDGWARLARWWARHPRAAVRTGRGVLGVFVAFPLVATLALAPVSSALFPFARMTTGAAFRTGAADRDRAAAVAHVPDDVCVVASAYLAVRLTPRDVVTLTALSRRHQDYAVLDLGTKEPDRFAIAPDLSPQAAYAQAVAAGWTVTFRAGQVVVLRAPDAAPSRACTP